MGVARQNGSTGMYFMRTYTLLGVLFFQSCLPCFPSFFPCLQKSWEGESNMAKKRGFWVSTAALLLILFLSLSGCGQPATAPGDDEPEPAEEPAETYQIGIVQLVEHPALNAAKDGFVDALADEGFVEDENLTIDFKNAQGEQPTAVTISEGFVADNVDLILAIATPAVQAAATVTDQIPIIFNSVTEPQEAGVVESWEQPNTNVTGASDMNPVKEQLSLLLEIAPDAENVGIIYDSGEVNSVVQVEMAKEAAAELGINIEESVATHSGEVSTAAEALVGKVDAIFIPTDNTVVTALSSVLRVAEENNLPTVSGDIESVENGAVATLGISYYSLGYQSGLMAAEVLRGADPAGMPVQLAEDVTYAVNLAAAEKMGLELPENLVEKARADDQVFGE